MQEIQQNNPQVQTQKNKYQIQKQDLQSRQQLTPNSKIQQKKYHISDQAQLICSQRQILVKLKESRSIVHHRYVALGREKQKLKFANKIEKTKLRLDQRQDRAKELKKQFQQQKLKRIKQLILTKQSLMSRRRAFLQYQHISSEYHKKTQSNFSKPNNEQQRIKGKKSSLKQCYSANKLFAHNRQQKKLPSKQWFIKFLKMRKNQSSLQIYQECDALINARQQFKRLQTIL